MRGARRFAEETLTNIRRARNARAPWSTARSARSPRGWLALVLQFSIVGDRIAEMSVIISSDRLRRLELAVLGRGSAASALTVDPIGVPLVSRGA